MQTQKAQSQKQGGLRAADREGRELQAGRGFGVLVLHNIECQGNMMTYAVPCGAYKAGGDEILHSALAPEDEEVYDS